MLKRVHRRRTNVIEQEQLTTYCVLPACNGTHLTVKLPACVPPAIELDEGLFALLLSRHTRQHETHPDAVLTFAAVCGAYVSN